MKPYYQDDFVTLYHGDALVLTPDLHGDVLVTDPPYIGREDLFSTAATLGVIDDLLGRFASAFVFWPCIGPMPVRIPDSVHVWHKAIPIHPNSKIGNVAGHHYERILCYGPGKKCEVFRYAAIMPNFAACRGELEAHPTQKPLELVQTLIARTRGTVLDPFAGSGTTLRAAKNLGRKTIGIEIEERYCEMAARRLSQEVLDLGGAA